MQDISVRGFRFGAVAAGIKASGALDMALLAADGPVAAAGAFTTNRVAAPSVRITRERIRDGRLQAIFVNSGNANVATGAKGVADAEALTADVAAALGADPGVVAISSTGIIGRALPLGKMRAAVPALVRRLRPDGLEEVARGIMTTDTRPKIAVRDAEVAGRTIRVAGVAKGAGMIAPNMATMLAFVVTDAPAVPAVLRDAMARALPRSFNAITVDGDMSTSDTVLLLASGGAGGAELRLRDEGIETFYGAVTAVMEDLAIAIVRDGEGAKKFVTVRVAGARNASDARTVAKAIAESLLVKTALNGEDPNWGRVLCAAGYAGPAFDPERVDIAFGGVTVLRAGAAVGPDADRAAAEVMKAPEIEIRVDLRAGEGEARYYTTDLSHEYVTINADYHT